MRMVIDLSMTIKMTFKIVRRFVFEKQGLDIYAPLNKSKFSAPEPFFARSHFLVRTQVAISKRVRISNLEQ